MNNPTINHIWNNDYDGKTKLEVNDGEFSVIDIATVKVKSSKTLKEEAISELETAKTGDKKIDKKIDRVTGHIKNSLDINLWIDASHLVSFSKKNNCADSEIFELKPDKIDLEEMFEFETNDNDIGPEGCLGPKFGIRVFQEEYTVIKLMGKEFKGLLKNIRQIKSSF